MVGRVGEGDPRARVPDPGARTRLAYEVTVGALHGMYGRRRWGGEDRPASQLAVSGRSSRAGLGQSALRRALQQTQARGRFPAAVTRTRAGEAVYGGARGRGNAAHSP